MSHGSPAALHEGSSSTGVCVARSAHEPICKSRLQGGDIPAPGEGSLAQPMPVASILCQLMQRGVGQPAASPGAWGGGRGGPPARGSRPPAASCAAPRHRTAPGGPARSGAQRLLAPGGHGARRGAGGGVCGWGCMCGESRLPPPRFLRSLPSLLPRQPCPAQPLLETLRMQRRVPARDRPWGPSPLMTCPN